MSGGFTVSDVDRMTYGECERYYDFKRTERRTEIEALVKLFAFHNLKGSLMGARGTESAIKEYQESLFDSSEEESQEEMDADTAHIESQFQGEDFERQ